MQRGVKYTEHKPFGRHYLGGYITTVSSAVNMLYSYLGGYITTVSSAVNMLYSSCWEYVYMYLPAETWCTLS
jgi:hypothetical protein